MSADTPERRGERMPYFSYAELRVILEKYEENKTDLLEKSNTTAASRRRQMAWQRIADCINASNPTGIQRTWEQIKQKHKNITNAKKKKHLQRRTASKGGSAPVNTSTEEPANDDGYPVITGVEGGVSSNPGASSSKYVAMDGDIVMVVVPDVPSTETMSQTEVAEPKDVEVTSDSSDSTVEEKYTPRAARQAAPQAAPQASTSTAPVSRAVTSKKGSNERTADPMRTLYKRTLEQDIKYKGLKMKKMELEIEYLQLKIRKLQEQGKENVHVHIKCENAMDSM